MWAPVLLGKFPAADWRPVLGMVRNACLPNVTEIGHWLRPYGSKNTNFFVMTETSMSSSIMPYPPLPPSILVKLVVCPHVSVVLEHLCWYQSPCQSWAGEPGTNSMNQRGSHRDRMISTADMKVKRKATTLTGLILAILIKTLIFRRGLENVRYLIS